MMEKMNIEPEPKDSDSFREEQMIEEQLSDM